MQSDLTTFEETASARLKRVQVGLYTKDPAKLHPSAAPFDVALDSQLAHLAYDLFVDGGSTLAVYSDGSEQQEWEVVLQLVYRCRQTSTREAMASASRLMAACQATLVDTTCPTWSTLGPPSRTWLAPTKGQSYRWLLLEARFRSVVHWSPPTTELSA